VTIQSPLPPDVALERIGWSFDAPLGGLALFARGRILGLIRRNRFEMNIRPSVFGNSGYPRPCCHGEVLPDGDGSMVTCDFDMLVTRFFFAPFFGLLVLAFPVGVAAALVDPRLAQFLVVIPAVMLAALFVLWSVRTDQDRDARELEELIRMAVEDD
jgi:hypothetical protein